MVLVTGDGDADDGYPPPHLLLLLRTDQRQTVRGGRLKPLGTDQPALRQ